MEVNFIIEENIYLKSKEKLYDIHNEYDFIRLEFDNESNSLILYWKAIESDNKIKIHHRQLEYYYSSKSFTKAQPDLEDSRTISSITFFSSETRDIHDNITYQNTPNSTDDIIYLFENEDVIRVKCKEVFIEELLAHPKLARAKLSNG